VAMLPSHVSCHGANDLHCRRPETTDTGLHHEEVRFHSTAGGCPKVQNLHTDYGATDCRGMSSLRSLPLTFIDIFRC
jgi:hypothetical protein